MTLISHWASALWLKENKRLKDAYQQFVRFNLENHQARLENSRDRLITARLLVAPYIVNSPFLPHRLLQLPIPLRHIIITLISPLPPQTYMWFINNTCKFVFIDANG
ncbi:5212_t:CDS:1 [Funneliformis mosseae]|uniref:5212_t:CDS:1 n=1 Tax=Funneliformis mosseae TaxID=27381 RepID=A0A9N8VW58_FUNMO|nr:5212_t:CDS:1 [Funneliformis mosseae]